MELTRAEAGPARPAADRHRPSLAPVPALDGIRALAVAAVMAFHGGVVLRTGGFLGVDTFFTLSGFLITSLLLTEWQQSATIRLRAFWARRARRLLPALLVMVLAVALASATLLPPGTFPDLRGDGLAALFYVANWHFIAAGSSYFGQTGPVSPLTHTWSLAVEEQFYLVWPLVVLAVLKLRRSSLAVLVVSVAGAAASALEMALLYRPAAVTRLYYGTDTRAQALLVGAAAAAALSWAAQHRPASPGSPLGRRLAGILALAGVAATAVLWTTVSGDAASTYRGGFLLAGLSAAAVVVGVVLAPRSVAARCLSVAPLRYLGRISYGMYLWHFPLFLFLDNARTGLIGYPLFAVRAAATVALSAFSFHAVEQPIRHGTFLRGWRAALASPLAVAAVVAAIFSATTVPAFAVRQPAPPRTTATATGQATASEAATAGPATAEATTATAAAAAGAPASARLPVRVLWVGDSTAFTLAIALSAEQGNYGVQSLDAGILGCGVTMGEQFDVKGVAMPMAPPCLPGPADHQWPQIWRNDISFYKPDVVIILAGRWEVANRTFDGQWTSIEDPTYRAYVDSQLTTAAAVAGAGGAHVILATAPCYDSGEQPDGEPWPEDSPARLALYNQLVHQVAAATPGASVLDLNALVCPGGHYDEYLDGVQVRTSDGVHFAPTAGAALSARFWPEVVAADGASGATASVGHPSPLFDRFRPEPVAGDEAPTGPASVRPS